MTKETIAGPSKMDRITDVLTIAISEVLSGKLTKEIANTASRTACQAIKAHAVGTMLADQQDIDRKKIQLQYDRIAERKSRNN